MYKLWRKNKRFSNLWAKFLNSLDWKMQWEMLLGIFWDLLWGLLWDMLFGTCLFALGSMGRYSQNGIQYYMDYYPTLD